MVHLEERLKLLSLLSQVKIQLLNFILEYHLICLLAFQSLLHVQNDLIPLSHLILQLLLLLPGLLCTLLHLLDLLFEHHYARFSIPSVLSFHAQLAKGLLMAVLDVTDKRVEL